MNPTPGVRLSPYDKGLPFIGISWQGIQNHGGSEDGPGNPAFHNLIFSFKVSTDHWVTCIFFSDSASGCISNLFYRSILQLLQDMCNGCLYVWLRKVNVYS